MELWAIDWNPAAALDPVAYSVIALHRGSSTNRALVECTAAAAARLRDYPTVHGLRRAKDGDTHVDDDTGRTIIVEGNGTRWREL